MTRCLVVDDDAAIRTLLQSFLQQHGLQGETLGDGPALRRRLPQGGVDMLVLDLMLPDDNGLAPWTKQQQPALPVIMLTAQGDLVSRVLALAHPAALKRIVGTRVGNALRYGGNAA